MVKKFTGKKVTMWISIILAISILLGIAVPENIQADGTENPDAIYSITAFQNPEYTFQTVDGKTTTTKVLSGQDVKLLFFGMTTCGTSWLTLKNIAESSWIQNPKISVLYVDVNWADAEVIQGTIDQFAGMGENEAVFRQGCEKITFCHDADGKNENVRKKYYALSGKFGTIALPMILLIDKNNMVREMLTNYQGADGILSVINQVIATGNAAEEDKKDEQGTDESGKDDTEKDNNGTDEAGTNDIAKDDAGTNDASSRYRDVKPENVRLSKTSLTYNGKAQKPAVSAKDAKGEQISSADYTVTYSNNINVGQAAVTIVFKNGYNGTIRKTFLIKPKGTALVKLTPKKRGFIVQWKKQKCQISGYEVQYATNKRFRSAKTMKNIKTKTTEMKAVKLKSRKTYYVRIRTCKTVKINGKNTKLYSGWSKAKSIVAK